MNAKSKIVSLDETLRSNKGSHAQESTKSAHLPGLIASIQAQVTQVLGSYTPRLFEKVDDAMFDLAEQPANFSEQNSYLDAMRLLRLNRDKVSQDFIERVFRSLEFSCNASTGVIQFTSLQKNQQETSDAQASVDSGSFSMLDDERMEEMLALDSMVKKFETDHSEILLLLDARFAQLAGVDPSARGERRWVNPLSTRAISKHFVAASAILGLDIKARIVVYKWFEKQMSACLGKLYARVNEQLIKANILPELTRESLQKSVGRTATASAAVQPVASSESNLEPVAESSPSFNLFDERSRQLADFVGVQSTIALMNSSNTPHYAPSLAGQISLIPASEQPAINREALHGLWHTLQISSLGRQMPAANGMPCITSPEVVVKGFLSALTQAQPQASISSQDRDVIGLVAVLFKFIIDDRVVAEPMKAAISRLQVPFIKAAINDASFFNDNKHPARSLLNTMAEATVGWVPGDNWESDPLYLAICTAVEHVTEQFNSDLGVFEDAEQALKAFLKSEAKRADMRKKRLVETEQGRDQTAVIKNYITEQISAQLEEQTPEFIRKMMLGAWSQWLFIIYHREGEDSVCWKQSLESVRELLWTISAKRCAANRHEILALLPDLIKLLRKGLEAVGHDRQEVARFFAQLEKMHLQVMERISPVAAVNEENTDTKLTQGTNSTSISTLLNKDLDLSVKTAESGQTDPWLEQAAALSVGQWVELSDDAGKKSRCRLVAILRNSGNRIFVDRSGCKAGELSIESIAAMLQSEQIELLEDTRLFDKALTSIIDNLRSRKKAATA